MALVCEGTSDDRFLAEVLRRSAQEVCGPGTEVAEARIVRASAGPASRADIIRALERADGSFTLVAYHRDGGGHPDQALERWFVPMRDALVAAGRREPVTPVVPVRETEAWALADGDALREVLGITWPDVRLGLPARRRDLESIDDPKRFLRRLVEQVTSWDADLFDQLGECVSLDALRELGAFRRWENDLEEALKSLPGFSTR